MSKKYTRGIFMLKNPVYDLKKRKSQQKNDCFWNIPKKYQKYEVNLNEY